jgi:hypothetical protein
MSERKTPVLLRRSPLTGEVWALRVLHSPSLRSVAIAVDCLAVAVAVTLRAPFKLCFLLALPVLVAIVAAAYFDALRERRELEEQYREARKGHREWEAGREARAIHAEAQHILAVEREVERLRAERPGAACDRRNTEGHGRSSTPPNGDA